MPGRLFGTLFFTDSMVSHGGESCVCGLAYVRQNPKVRARKAINLCADCTLCGSAEGHCAW